ncbi:class I SAM-dependent methyltransferase [Streptomyces sp. DT171]|uniref:class I SAM-dependent methyltransferase n=1 Tax=Streptomyces sp. DT171 TaxID=3416524 RepID=UPI003CF125CC
MGVAQGGTGPAGRPPMTGAAYRDAFALFLAGTDEKRATHAYLSDLASELPARRTFLDVGPGDGTTTRCLGRYFEHTVCIEPSAHMRELLRRDCPAATVLSAPVLEAEVRSPPVDLALLSHVLYYVPRTDWVPTVLRVLNWVEPGREALVVLQDPDNDCMRMVRHFTGARFALSELAADLRTSSAAHADTVGAMRRMTLPARYHSTSLADTVTVARFHLGVHIQGERETLPDSRELESYVRDHFADPDGGYTIPHAHEVLHIERVPAS